MLTDIFAHRYASRAIWGNSGETEKRLLTQCFRIVSEQLYTYWGSDGKANPVSKEKWKAIHDKLSMELGLHELGPRYSFSTRTWNNQTYTTTHEWSWDHICKGFVCAKYDDSVPADRFMKERISFVELAFRQREEDLAGENRDLPRRLAEALKGQTTRQGMRLRVPGDPGDGMRAFNKARNDAFRASVDELNERFKRANAPLNYHNGFIQIATDELIEDQIEKVFWALLADPMWSNVDTDMKEALDRRDANERDPAHYAARALESAIKIISDKKRWTHGGERGAHNYIDNLASKKNGAFIADWEATALKHFFTTVRNPLAHGPGDAPMPELSAKQTGWAIESCMSWIKSLIGRM